VVTDPAGLAPIKAFTAAVDARDIEALRATLHFPHFRLVGVRMDVIEHPADVRGPWETHGDAVRGSLDSWEVIDSNDDKAHFAIRVTRRSAADESLETFKSLWVVKKRKGAGA